MAQRYGRLPSEVLSTDLDDFLLNLSVYLYARGEEGMDHAWEMGQLELRGREGG